MSGTVFHNTLTYHPHILLTKFLTDTDYIRHGGSENHRLFESTEKDVVESVGRYKKLLDTHRTIYSGNCASSKPGEFSKLLYKPESFFCFGHTDCLSFTLVDDFTSVFHIISGKLNLSLEQFSIAFLPNMRKSGFSADKLRAANIQEATELFANRGYNFDTGEGIDLQKTPLLLLSRFKIDGLTLLGQGLNGQRAVFEAVISRIMEAKQFLKDAARNHPAKDACDLDERDINKTWCTFLDTQGAAEFSLLIGCNNFTIAGVILEKIQSMDLRSLFAERNNQRFKKRFYKETGLAERIYNLSPHSTNRNIEEACLDTHVLSSVYSVVACKYQAMQDENWPGWTPQEKNDEEWKNWRKNVKGAIVAEAGVQLKPGHLHTVRKDFEAAFARRPQPILSATDEEDRPKMNEQLWHLMRMGRNDIATAFDWRFHNLLIPDMIKTRKFLDTTLDALRFGANRLVLEADTGMNYCSANIAIPIPSCSDPDNAAETQITDAVKSAGHLNDEFLRIRIKEEFGMKIEQLDEHLRKLGVASTTRLRIVRAFSQFLARLTDPVLYDSVVDLYDSYFTLFRVLKEMCNDKNPLNNFLKHSEIEMLFEYVLALDNALNHRSAIGSPENEVKDVDINFFGALNQIAASSDAALRCFAGILKWYARCYRQDSPIYRADKTDDCYDRIGTVKSFALTAKDGELVRVRLAKNRLPNRHPKLDRNHKRYFSVDLRHSLSQVTVGVGNMFEPSTAFTDMHEASHLLQHAILDNLPTNHPHYVRSDKNEVAKDARSKRELDIERKRRDEIFANSLSGLFMFDFDHELFAIHEFNEFSQSLSFDIPVSTTTTEQNVAQKSMREKIGEFMVRTFVVYHLLQSRYREQPTFGDEYGFDWAGQFSRFLKNFAPYCRPAFAADILKPPHDNEFLYERLENEFVFKGARWKRIFDIAVEFYEQFSSEKYPWRPSDLTEKTTQSELRDKIRERREMSQKIIFRALKKGEVFIETRISEKLQEEVGQSEPNSIMITCDLVSSYMQLIYGRQAAWEMYSRQESSENVYSTKHRIHLIRGEEKNIDYRQPCPNTDDASKSWNLFQKACGYVGQFCPDPDWRGEMMKWKCVVIKKLWDLSRDRGLNRYRDMLKEFEKAVERRAKQDPAEDQQETAAVD